MGNTTMKYTALFLSAALLVACGDSSDLEESSSASSQDSESIEDKFFDGDVESEIASIIEAMGVEKNRQYLALTSQTPLSDKDLEDIDGVYRNVKVKDCQVFKFGANAVEDRMAPQSYSCKYSMKVNYMHQTPFEGTGIVNFELGDMFGPKDGDKLELIGTVDGFHRDVIDNANR